MKAYRFKIILKARNEESLEVKKNRTLALFSDHWEDDASLSEAKNAMLQKNDAPAFILCGLKMDSIFKCSMAVVPNEIEWRDRRKNTNAPESKMHERGNELNQTYKAIHFIRADDLTFWLMGCFTFKIRK